MDLLDGLLSLPCLTFGWMSELPLTTSHHWPTVLSALGNSSQLHCSNQARLDFNKHQAPPWGQAEAGLQCEPWVGPAQWDPWLGRAKL